MSDEKMREDFEAAVKVKWPGIRMLRINRPGAPYDGEYEQTELADAWWAWQASRAAIVVELPPERIARGYGEQVADALGFNDGVSERSQAIEAVGLKVKS